MPYSSKNRAFPPPPKKKQKKIAIAGSSPWHCWGQIVPAILRTWNPLVLGMIPASIGLNLTMCFKADENLNFSKWVHFRNYHEQLFF